MQQLTSIILQLYTCLHTDDFLMHKKRLFLHELSKDVTPLSNP